jgi:hypothetical protein
MSFISSVNSLEAAQGMAMRYCQLKTNQPDQCILLASIVPENFSTKSTSTTLSFETLEGFKEFLKKDDPSRYGAFAANEVWIYRWVTDRLSQKQAEADALQACEKAAANVVYRQVPRKWRKSVVGASDRCKVMYVSKPH